MEFNQSQRIAITHRDGPMLVLAGPGSGKTLVITRRTKYLIEECGVRPDQILVITFTKAAAIEMKERFQSLMEGSTKGVYFGTFHSIFFMILRYAYSFKGDNIIRDEQKLQFFRSIIQQLQLEFDDEKEFISGIEGEISLVKGDMLSLDHYYSMNCSEEIFKKIYQAYDDYLRRHHLIDFDDMLVFTYELFRERPDILAMWQKKFRYVLIDEFQDINRLQYEIIRMLVKPSNNLFIVGDDDQSIYRFRGAKPEIMLNFEKDFTNAKRVVLDVNYRSTKQIVEGALRVIKHNKKRFPKQIVTINEEGSPITTKVFDNLAAQNQEVVNQIMELRTQGLDFSQIAVIFRTNTQPRTLIEKLMEYNIPFKMKDAIPNIYEHWIAKNVIDYIQMALGDRSRAKFYQIMNRPKRYLSRECAPNAEIDFNQIMSYYSDKPWVMERLHKFEYDLEMIRDMNPFSAIYYIRKAVGYEEYLEEYATYRRINVEELIDTLNEIQEASKPYRSFADWFAHMEEYALELREQSMNRNNPEVDGVSMVTMHSSKGLEYEVVFLVDVNEEITPHRKAVLDEDMEEERRMFYVAMTRAKKQLFLYSVKERYNKELVVSRFVGEMTIDMDEVQKGTILIHKKYGKGRVIMKDHKKIVVQFDTLQTPRTLDIGYCITNQMIKITPEQKIKNSC